MTVSSVGSLAAAQFSTGTGTPRTPQAGLWGTNQNRSAGNLLVAVVTASGSTSAGTISQSGGSDWAKLIEYGGTYVKTAVFTKAATGGDAAPSFTANISGTATRCHMSVTLYELTDPGGTVPAVDTNNSSGAGTSGTLTVTTAGNISEVNEFAIGAECMQYTSSGTNTWGAGGGSWGTDVSDGTSTARYYHFVVGRNASAASGAALSYAPTHSQTSTGISGIVIAFKPGVEMSIATGDVHLKKMTVSGAGAGISVVSTGAGGVPGTVTFDAMGPGPGLNGIHSGSSPITWAHVNSAATNALVVVATSSAGPNAVTAVTYGGVTIPLLGTKPSQTTGGETAIYGKIGGLPTGSNTVSVTQNGGSGDVICASLSLADAVSFGTPVTANTDSTAGSVSASVPGTTTGGMIVVAAGWGGDGGAGSFSGTNGVTLRTTNKISSSSPMDNMAAGTVPSTGGGASQTVGISTGVGDWWTLVAVEVLPSLSAGLPGNSLKKMTIAGTGGMPQESVATGVINMKKMRIHGTGGLPLPIPYITSLAGGGLGYFIDQNADPILYAQCIAWGLPGNAGRWSSGDWQGEIEQMVDARTTQGFNCVRVHALGTTKTGCLSDNGDTWDGVHPFVTGTDPSSGLNETYWARVDYLIDYAATKGMVIEMNIAFTYDWGAGVLCNAWTTQQCTDWGTAIGNRYKDKPNVTWMFGDDNYQIQNTQFEAIHSGLRASGDTHLASIEMYPEGSTSLRDLSGTPSGSTFTWGRAHAQYNLCYYYYPTYFALEFAFQETSPIPPIWGDGFYIGEAGDDATSARIMRNMAWWALSSGARGISTGANNTMFWDSAEALTSLTTEEWFVSNADHIINYFKSLPGWNLLVPDYGNAFITAGRGTRLGWSDQHWQFNSHSNYVSGSITPDGKLAVIYCESAFSITIDDTKLGAGWTATWVDPMSCTTSTATAGGSSGARTFDSSVKGNNSDGFADWVLVLQGPGAVEESVATGAVKMKKMTIAVSSIGISVATGAVNQKKLKVAASGAGFADFTGSVKTKKMTVSASGTKVSTATAAISMKKMTVAGVSAGISVSTGAVKLKKMTVSVSGAGFADFTGSVKTKKMTVAGAGAGFTDATGVVRLRKMTVAGTGGPGAEESNATGAITLKKMSLSGSGAGISVTSGGPKLKKMTVSGAGAGITVASGGSKLKKMTVAAASAGIAVALGGPGLKKMSVSGSGGGIAVVISGPALKKMSVSGTGTAISAATGAVRMKKMSILGVEGEIGLLSGGPRMKKMTVAGTGAGISITSGGPVLKKMKVSGSGAGVSVASGSPGLKKMKILGVGAGLTIFSGDVVLKKATISGAGAGISAGTAAVMMKKMEVEGEAVKKVKADNMMIFSML